MAQNNIPCIIFPTNIWTLKGPENAAHVYIDTFDDSHNDSCLYAGQCTLLNDKHVGLDSLSELESQDCPMVFLPYNIKMEPTCKIAAVNNKLLMNVNILAQDFNGKDIQLHSGDCYINYYTNDDTNSTLEDSLDSASSDPFPELDSSEVNPLFSIDLDSNDLSLILNHGTIDPCVSKLWISDSAESADVHSFPYLCNQYDIGNNDFSLESYSKTSTLSAVSYEEDQNTEVGQMYEKATLYVSQENFDNNEGSDYTADIYFFDEDGVSLQLPDDINNNNNTTRTESRLSVGSDDVALKQLMSSNTHSSAKQQKIIMFSGTDILHGQTIQKISYNDPNYECPADKKKVIKDVIDSPQEDPNSKKYQCAKCQQIFNQLSNFKEHMVSHGVPRYTTRNGNSRTTTEFQFTCEQCGKKLKSQEKFEVHCLGHGDPDRECKICHNVFASKATLRTHMKIHNRKYRCQFCTKSFDKEKTLKTHTDKAHKHKTLTLPDEFLDEDMIRNEMKTEEVLEKSDGPKLQTVAASVDKPVEKKIGDKKRTKKVKKMGDKKETEDENDIINKAVTHEMFLSNDKRHSRCRKQCNVCPKSFDRISDLKRHLIEHTLTSTLRKNPVNANGTLDIQCCICNDSFNKIDKYKAHLREHANLTIYKCTFCDKSFSDSSNFSKHKKIHGFSSIQCDICQRKFNSKKMLEQHMVYHNENPPLPCSFCEKVFHFESTLKKHIKSAHTKESTSRFLCKPCGQYYGSLKAKWDHQWVDHKMRKSIFDCLMCGAKFRKYSELKRHCFDDHDTSIPLAKNIRKDSKSRRQVRVEVDI